MTSSNEQLVPVEQSVGELIEQLRARTRQSLPIDWQIGRDCPECSMGADRPKCAFDMGGSCPRHDPENYEPSPYLTLPDKLCHAAADMLERLAALHTPPAVEPDARQTLSDRFYSYLKAGPIMRIVGGDGKWRQVTEEQPAVEPDEGLVEIARRIAAEDAEARGAVQTGILFREGKADDSISVRVAIAAITAATPSIRAQALEEAAKVIDDAGAEYCGLREGVILARVSAIVRALKGEQGV